MNFTLGSVIEILRRSSRNSPRWFRSTRGNSNHRFVYHGIFPIVCSSSYLSALSVLELRSRVSGKSEMDRCSNLSARNESRRFSRFHEKSDLRGLTSAILGDAVNQRPSRCAARVFHRSSRSSIGKTNVPNVSKTRYSYSCVMYIQSNMPSNLFRFTRPTKEFENWTGIEGNRSMPTDRCTISKNAQNLDKVVTVLIRLYIGTCIIIPNEIFPYFVIDLFRSFYKCPMGASDSTSRTNR